MRRRREVLAGVMAAVAAFAVSRAPAVFGAPAAARTAAGSGAAAGPATLRIYYTNPTLVRAGERVLMPVDVVCALTSGEPCGASVTLGTRVGGEAWVETTSPAGADLRFDLTAPAGRALGDGSSGAVDFFLRAQGPGGATVALGSADPGRTLRFYVVRDLPRAHLPEIPFGRVRTGVVQLHLPWGTGPMRAGLRPGFEAPTLGPSSFAVNGHRLIVADDQQERIAVFRGSHLERSIPIGAGGAPHVVAATGGDVVMLRSSGTDLHATAFPGDGPPLHGPDAGIGIVSEVAATEDGAVARILPEDAWARFRMSGSELSREVAMTAGLPLADGTELVRIGREHALRVARVQGHRVVSAVELVSPLTLGELALARGDGRGGSVVVVRVARTEPAMDQFQVIRLAADGAVTSFAVSSDAFTVGPPLARFALGTDDGLYQLRTSPDGMRIVRFDLGVAS
jgi:hypothetical protein